MIAPRTGRWSQTEVADLIEAHSKGELSNEESAAKWGLAHNRTPEAMFQKLVDLGRERRRVIKGEVIQPLSDDELIALTASRLAAKGVPPERSAALLDLLRVALT